MINLRYKYSLVDLSGLLRWVKTANHNYFWVLIDYQGMLAHYTCVSVGV